MIALTKIWSEPRPSASFLSSLESCPHPLTCLAPSVRFDTPCFHPNVDTSGYICLDILKENWSAVYNVQSILLSIQSLLGEPNPDSPLNSQAAQLWKTQEE